MRISDWSSDVCSSDLQGRASELLYTGRAMTADEGLGWGFFNSLHASDAVFDAAWAMARQIADGPTFAPAMTKQLLHQEWALGVDGATGAEAQARSDETRVGQAWVSTFSYW